jgi:phage gp36-like protein
MSTFITRDDYGNSIRENILDAVTDFDDTKLVNAEERAVSKIKGYLTSRYDTVAIFAKTGTLRDIEILGYAVDLSLYYLHRQINPRKVPAFRKEAWDEAVSWLEGVQALEINPPALDQYKPTDGKKNSITYGSNPKRSNHI